MILTLVFVLQSIASMAQVEWTTFNAADYFKDRGAAGFSSFVRENYIYPDSALKNDVSGKVVVRFTVDTLGMVSDVSTPNKKLGYGLEEEAVRIIESTTGMWNPFVLRGVKQSWTWTIPLNICIF